MLNQWWVWLVIIFIVLFVVWVWSRFTGEPSSKSKTEDIKEESSQTSDTTDESETVTITRTTRKELTRKATKEERASVPIVSSFCSTLSSSRPTLTREMILKHDSLEQQSKKRGKTLSQSKGEAECLRVLEKLRGRKARVQVRDLKVLRNSVTGRNLELDIYFEDDIKIEGYRHLACEYNGRQHRELVPHFHKDGEEDFKYQQWKDAEKADMCDRAGIYLISVPDTLELDEIEEFITYFLPENAYKRYLEDKIRI